MSRVRVRKMTISTQILERIKYYAGYPQTSVSLSQMVKFGQNLDPIALLKGTKFVHRELPVRLAHRVIELENLPFNLSAMPSIRTVQRWYTESFRDLMELPEYNLDSSFQLEKSKYFTEKPETLPMPEGALDYIQTLTKTIELIKKRHDPTQMTIAQGILELKEYRSKSGKYKMDDEERLPEAVQAFLDRFYLSRIGIRMLIGQHVALTKSYFDPASVPKDYVGIICTKTNIGQIAQEAIDNARFICQEYYGLYDAPQVKIMGTPNISFMYVPSHLHQMLFELLKNSLRAVVERFGTDSEQFPEVRLVIVEGNEDITVKISDEGGGIPRSDLPLVWTYMYTTADNPMKQDSYSGTNVVPMAGYGYGLPISRLYASYFGGNLNLISMEGFGTDAYLHLRRLSDSDEPLT